MNERFPQRRRQFQRRRDVGRQWDRLGQAKTDECATAVRRKVVHPPDELLTDSHFGPEPDAVGPRKDRGHSIVVAVGAAADGELSEAAAGEGEAAAEEETGGENRQHYPHRPPPDNCASPNGFEVLIGTGIGLVSPAPVQMGRASSRHSGSATANWSRSVDTFNRMRAR